MREEAGLLGLLVRRLPIVYPMHKIYISTIDQVAVVSSSLHLQKRHSLTPTHLNRRLSHLAHLT